MSDQTRRDSLPFLEICEKCSDCVFNSFSSKSKLDSNPSAYCLVVAATAPRWASDALQNALESGLLAFTRRSPSHQPVYSLNSKRFQTIPNDPKRFNTPYCFCWTNSLSAQANPLLRSDFTAPTDFGEQRTDHNETIAGLPNQLHCVRLIRFV